jgi:hypothetical protein
MSNVAFDDQVSWEEAVEKQRREFEELNRPYELKSQEEARVKAEQEAIHTKRQLELFVRKSTLPFSEPLAIEICERISSGELLINITLDEYMPSTRRVTQWLRENSDFSLLYKESINDRLDFFSEEVIKIADDAARDFRDVVRNGRTVRVLDGDAIARAKLRVEVRLKHLRAFRPSIWSESSTLTVRSSGDDIDNMTQEEMDKKIAELESKEAVVREPKAA